MKTTTLFGTIGGVIAATAVIAGCGSDSKSTKTPAAAGATSAATKPAGGQPSTTPRTQVDNLMISAKDFSFTANLTSVRPGNPGVDVFFKNEGGTTHTLTFFTDSGYTKKLGSADSGNVAAGQSVGFPFIPPAGATSVYYRCEIHPAQMKGELAVK